MTSKNTKIILQNIPYRFKEHGYDWTLLSVINNFSKNDTLVSCEYENQYGHLRRIENKELLYDKED